MARNNSRVNNNDAVITDDDLQLISDAVAKAHAEDADGGKFSGAGKQKEMVTVQSGDIVHVPADAVCKKIPMRGGNTYEGYYCILQRGDARMAVAITPGMFSRSFVPVDKNTGKPLPNRDRVSCSGTAVDLFYSGTDLDDQMSKLKGRSIVFTAIDKSNYSYNEDFMTKPKATNIYTIDLA